MLAIGGNPGVPLMIKHWALDEKKKKKEENVELNLSLNITTLSYG